MMKKLFYLTALLLGANTVQAWQGNWLVGFSGGYQWYRGDVDISLFINDEDGITAINDFNDRNNGDSWLLGILAGYQINCNYWLLGLELNLDWQGKDNKQNYAFLTADNDGNLIGATFSALYKRDATLGLTARLGYEITSWFMPYLRAGVERSKDRLHVDAQLGGILAALGLNLDADASRHSYHFIGGVGAEMPLPLLDQLTFRAEYNYHSKNRRVVSTTEWLPVGSTVFSTIGTKHEAHSAKASIVYNF